MQRLTVPKGVLAGLSGKLVFLTIAFIMFVEILVLLPSIANFRNNWLDDKMHTAESAVVALNDNPKFRLSNEAQEDLLKITDARAVILEQDGTRRFILTMELPNEIAHQVNMEDMGKFSSVFSSYSYFFLKNDSFIRVVGKMDVLPGNLELILEGAKLRDDLWVFARNVLLISLIIALFTAVLIYLSMRWLIIRPIQWISNNMVSFSDDPESKNGVICSTSRQDEIGIAQNHLREMQGELQSVLSEKKHLANLGLAVSKINHDMRNILTSALLFSDRLNAVDDPKVQSFAPKLVSTIERATQYTQNVLEYGKAKEAPIENKNEENLFDLGEDVAELLALDRAQDISWHNNVSPDQMVYCEREQLFRVLMNLARNSVQAMREKGEGLENLSLSLSSKTRGQMTVIILADTGPGVPQQAREKLFQAFQGSTRSGGTGLGLAIAGEIINAHGGTIKLCDAVENKQGAVFEISLPKA